MHTPHRRSSAVFALAFAACAGSALAQQKEVGDQWEITTEMSMQGMTMPGMTQKVCSPRGADPIPATDEKEKCETYDVKHSGSTVSWKMRCTNPASTGTGEMTYKGRDSYAGKMTMQTGGDTMQMKLSGRRLGECDAGETKRQVAAFQKQAADAQRLSDEQRAKVCADSLKEMRVQTFMSDSGMACTPAQKKEFCGKFQTNDGFAKVARQTPAPGGAEVAAAGKACGVDGEALRTRLCKTAEANESVDFLADACVYVKPAYGTKIAARECAGRGYTSPVAAKYSKFCTAFARNNAMQAEGDTTSKPAATTAPAKSVTDDAVSKGKELLKGLFH